jgi:ABC-2 type transport system permease protein
MNTAFKSATRFIEKTFVITELEVRKLRHDFTDLFTRAIQPALWLLLFGEVFTRMRTPPSGDVPYLDFMTPGILAQSVLFVAIFYGINVIWERDLGIVHKLLASPAPRASLVLGKALSASIRGLSQAVIIYILGVTINASPLAIAGVVFVVIVAAAMFSTFSLIIASIVKTRDRFMGIGQVLTMPLFFASNAIYPISIMPHWLQVIAPSQSADLCRRRAARSHALRRYQFTRADARFRRDAVGNSSPDRNRRKSLSAYRRLNECEVDVSKMAVEVAELRRSTL